MAAAGMPDPSVAYVLCRSPPVKMPETVPLQPSTPPLSAYVASTLTSQRVLRVSRPPQLVHLRQ